MGQFVLDPVINPEGAAHIQTRLMPFSVYSQSLIWLGCSSDAGAQFESNLGKILALGAEILPYIGLREMGVSIKKTFSSFQHTKDKL